MWRSEGRDRNTAREDTKEDERRRGGESQGGEWERNGRAGREAAKIIARDS